MPTSSPSLLPHVLVSPCTLVLHIIPSCPTFLALTLHPSLSILAVGARARVSYPPRQVRELWLGGRELAGGVGRARGRTRKDKGEGKGRGERMHGVGGGGTVEHPEVEAGVRVLRREREGEGASIELGTSRRPCYCHSPPVLTTFTPHVLISPPMARGRRRCLVPPKHGIFKTFRGVVVVMHLVEGLLHVNEDVVCVAECALEQEKGLGGWERRRQRVGADSGGGWGGLGRERVRIREGEGWWRKGPSLRKRLVPTVQSQMMEGSASNRQNGMAVRCISVAHFILDYEQNPDGGMTILVGVGSGKREDQGEIVRSGQESRIREALGTAEVLCCQYLTYAPPYVCLFRGPWAEQNDERQQGTGAPRM
ncbi:hypothetical protein FA13DRAFT_1712419 [Coprinellus micaceus]|uniref:Uncharacterized protein n=1 Tax=Coprinellus micaceus TaxID=71717 RepID=A0A4Y7T0N6_COPMI|nr:hypothetical protein FA13DRAFT_1712419 [Coprinellus micaceus]